MKRLRRGQEFWKRLIEEFKGSGESQRSFAASRGVSLSTLQSWLYRVRRGSAAVTETGSRRVRFVEVKTSEAAAAPERSPSVEIELPGGVHVRLGAGGDVAAVAEVIALVAARVRC